MTVRTGRGTGTGEMALAQVVRGMRQRSFLTQEQLAKTAGLSVRTIRRLENGTMLSPRMSSLALLAEALKLDAAGRAQLAAAVRAARHRPVEDTLRRARS